MYKLWLEWDLGQDTIIFTSKEKGMKWLEKNMDCDLKQYYKSAQDIMDEGMGSFQEIVII